MTKGFSATVLVKLETTNPGGSIKDRIAVAMIEDAEAKGLLKPGATIVEWTAGNTGIGLALVCAVKGYKSIFVMPDKVSQEKIDLLRALGSEVVITPTAVKPDDPRSVYSVVEHLAKTLPNVYYPNQFENPSNPRIHAETTGKEIWDQTEGKVTHVFAAAGTGGTASGIARFLKAKNPAIKVIAVDPVGSAYREFFKTGQMPAEMGLYKVEGMGGSKIPKTIDFSLLDDVVQVSDRDAFNCGRRLSRAEGIFAGGSSGATLFAALQEAQHLSSDSVVVAMITDSGERYISKMYNDLWMKENNFLQPFAADKSLLTAGDILHHKASQELIYVTPETTLFDTFELMKHHEISQVPIISDGAPIGSISEKSILTILLRDETAKTNKVIGFMERAFPLHPSDTLLSELTQEFSRETNAVLIGDPRQSEYHILTRSDIIAAITS